MTNEGVPLVGATQRVSRVHGVRRYLTAQAPAPGWVGLFVPCLLLVALRAPSQGSAPPERVIHLWVDPVYGDDGGTGSTTGGAPLLNPPGYVGCANEPWSGNPAARPNSVLDHAQGSAPLLHAPWPFKTITKAISYIPTLPFTDPTTGIVWRYAIVHLLPGLYARSNVTMAHESGLQPNGETFPIRLPPYVSVQGTSALNTVLWLGSVSYGGPAFEFGRRTNDAGVQLSYFSTGEGTFIDKLAIYGAKDGGTNTRPMPDAAIALYPDVSSRPMITNCFIFASQVGIAVAASRPADPVPLVVHDGTAIINCTFAFNGCGIWNGQLNADGISPQSGGMIGYSKLIVVNNVFDAGIDSLAGNLLYHAAWLSCPRVGDLFSVKATSKVSPRRT